MVDRRRCVSRMLSLHALRNVPPSFPPSALRQSDTNRMSLHNSQLLTMTATWLLPIVTTIVAASSGGVVAAILPNDQHAFHTLIISYILWGTGVPFAMAILTIYFQRLTIHHLPPREVIVSVFLPLGPLGQGGFGIMQLGKVAMDLFPKTGTLQLANGSVNAGDCILGVG